MPTNTTTQQINGVNVDVLKGTVGAIQADPELAKCRFRASNKCVDGAHNCTSIKDFFGAKQEMSHKQEFHIHADEPPILAGADEAANPVEILLGALASCVTTGMVAHAAVNGIQIEELESHLEGDIDLRGFLGLDATVPKGYTDIRVTFKVKTDTENLAKLRRYAEFSPVYNTLIHGTNVDIQIEPK